MPTIIEFVESKELEEMIGIDKYPKYKSKFIKIIHRAGVGNFHITDESAINKLNYGGFVGMGTLNWYAFFFTFFWSLYLNITSGRNNQWVYLAILIGIYLLLDTVGFSSIISSIVFFISVAFGVQGNGLFLRELIRKYNNGHRGPIPKSTLNIFIVLGIFLIYGFVITN